jgi:glycosyltransferase involved in cell wall biosynthesis
MDARRALMQRPLGVELAGFLESAVGAGEAARRYLGALRSIGVPVRARDVELPGRDPAQTAFHDGGRFGLRTTRCNLICLNPEQLLPYLASSAAPSGRRRATVAAWNWEVDVLPPGWADAAGEVAEIWACSEFTASFIRAGTGASVISVPPPLTIATASPSEAPGPALPAGPRVLVIFDYLSTIQRKNPVGAIEAYRQAFAPGDGAQLIVKSVNGVHRAEAREQVERAAGGRRDIVLMDGTISGAALDALVATCDCLLSVHRSEGFGLSLADAMAAAKPVVATAYGGNTEFMSSSNSYLVPYEITSVGDGCEHYPPEAHWAEPDISNAAAALREIAGDTDAARERGLLARADVRELLAPQRIGWLMAERFAVLRGGTPG